MNKYARDMIGLAEAEGLVFKEMGQNSKHDYLVFENNAGAHMQMTIGTGGRGGDTAGYVYKNARARFRRFARGQYHDIILLKKPREVTTHESTAQVHRAQTGRSTAHP